MKKILLGIIIGITLSAPITYAGIKYIQVPEIIKGYNTLELLNYLADLKAKEDVKVQIKTYQEKLITPNIKVIPSAPQQPAEKGRTSA